MFVKAEAMKGALRTTRSAAIMLVAEKLTLRNVMYQIVEKYGLPFRLKKHAPVYFHSFKIYEIFSLLLHIDMGASKQLPFSSSLCTHIRIEMCNHLN